MWQGDGDELAVPAQSRTRKPFRTHDAPESMGQVRAFSFPGPLYLEEQRRSNLAGGSVRVGEYRRSWEVSMGSRMAWWERRRVKRALIRRTSAHLYPAFPSG